MYYVYVLRSQKDEKLYYGYTRDLKLRLNQHNNGGVQATKYRRPFEVAYFEKVNTKEEALSKERYFKSGFGRKYIKNKLKNISDGLPASLLLRELAGPHDVREQAGPIV